MVRHKRKADWDHTALLEMTLRKVMGDKTARFENPYRYDENQKLLRRQWAAIVDEELKGQRLNGN